MTADTVIIAEHLSKSYLIRHQSGPRYVALRDVMADGARHLGHRLLRSSGPSLNGKSADLSREEFWALQDLSFSIRQGERVGIIGRNGAGKSTLLKILSRITDPTAGRVRIRGRVASLLEVGTGFHPELTGRENIYLNGAVLGMKRGEIKARFDEIVAFAEVEKFLDTPMKRYSSGMQVRLAFAVAAHLEPDILIVDEVLAVGDASFQRKCLGKMSAVAEEGRTVVVVSHQLNQIRRLCDRCIWLSGGRVQRVGPTVPVLADYESSLASRAAAGVAGTRDHEETGTRFLSWEILSPCAGEPYVLESLGPVTVRFLLRVVAPIRHGHQGIALFSQDGQLMWATAVDPLALDSGVHALAYSFPSLPLRPGPYQWHLSITDDGQRIDDWFGHPELVIATPPITHPQERFQGILNLPWTFDPQPL